MSESTNATNAYDETGNFGPIHDIYWKGYSDGQTDSWAANGGGDETIWFGPPRFTCPVHGDINPHDLLAHDSCWEEST